MNKIKLQKRIEEACANDKSHTEKIIEEYHE